VGEVVARDGWQREGGQLGQGRVGGLERLALPAQRAEARLRARVSSDCGAPLSVSESRPRVSRGARRGGVGAEVILREGDGERVVGREVQFRVRLPQYLEIAVSQGRRWGGWTHFTTAMLTGAVVLALYIAWSAIAVYLSLVFS